MSVRRRLAVIVTAAAVLSGALVSAAGPAFAGPPAENFGCQPTFATLGPDGSLDQRIAVHENVTATPWTDWISSSSGVSTMSSMAQIHLESSDRWYFRSLMVKNGSLTHAMTSYPNGNPERRSTALRQYGRGWAPVTRLVDATDRGTAVTKNGYVYALNPTAGTLARYRVVEGPSFGDLTVTSAGSAAGYGGFRGLTLAYRYRAGYRGAADVLLATTRTGALYQITISNTSAYAPKLTLVRASSWTFDQVAAVPCDNSVACWAFAPGATRPSSTGSTRSPARPASSAATAGSAPHRGRPPTPWGPGTGCRGRRAGDAVRVRAAALTRGRTGGVDGASLSVVCGRMSG